MARNVSAARDTVGAAGRSLPCMSAAITTLRAASPNQKKHAMLRQRMRSAPHAWNSRLTKKLVGALGLGLRLGLRRGACGCCMYSGGGTATSSGDKCLRIYVIKHSGLRSVGYLGVRERCGAVWCILYG